MLCVMTPDVDDLHECEAIAGARVVDFGGELRERVASILGCDPESLHPDRVRRADA